MEYTAGWLQDWVEESAEHLHETCVRGAQHGTKFSTYSISDFRIVIVVGC